MAAMAGLFLTGYDAVQGHRLRHDRRGRRRDGRLADRTAGAAAWLGPQSEPGPDPVPGHRRTAARPSRVWAALARRVVRRPLLWGGAAAIALLMLATPALGMRLGSRGHRPAGQFPGAADDERDQQAFPQTPSPAQVVVTGMDLTGPAMRDAIAALNARAAPAGPAGPIREPITNTPVAGGPRCLSTSR